MKVQLSRTSLRSGASVVALSALLGTTGASASNLPTHGHFISGQGSIAKANQSITVKQSSTTGIINWNSFSVGAKNGVIFDNGAGATLNRVTGGNLSRIAGSLHATGSLYLMNSNGVIVSGTGHIVTGGSFAASSGSLTNSAFDDNERRFKAGTANVVNRGSITAGGSATLVGANVSDKGTIRAAAVNLQATHNLSMDGSVTARKADGSGGTIIATAHSISVGSKANISASGTKGGTVLIGGDVHGGAIAADNFVKQDVGTAQSATVASGAHISADGSKTSGGNIVIWSNGHTSFAGQISATGQSKGGFSEVSSHDLLGFAGTVNLTSAHGSTGTLLLDPYNVTISTAASSTDTCSDGTCKPTGNTSNINVTTLENALAAADVIVATRGSGEQPGDITVLAPLTWSANTLSLDASRGINIDADVSVTGTAGLSLSLQADTTTKAYLDFGLGPNGFADHITFANASETLTINRKNYTLIGSMSDLQNINNNLAGNYALANSLDASSTTGWIPIGTDGSGNVLNGGKGFSGAFLGLGNTISNFSMSSTSYAGLFGYSSGEIQAIGMLNDSISGEDAGGLAGTNAGTILNSYASGVVAYPFDVNERSGEAGGLVADNSGYITGSFSAGSVSGNGFDSSAGGLVGYNIHGHIKSAYSTASVSGGGSGAIGGLVGSSHGSISRSYATGAVTGDDAALIGGLVGYNDFSKISDSHATGAVANTNSGGATGGLVGDNAGGVIANSYATGSVIATGDDEDGEQYTGGFVGVSIEGGISQCFATGAVAGGGGETGGFGGYLASTISENFSTGAVTGGGYVGGFVGLLQAGGSVDHSYSMGNVTATSGTLETGGFAGEVYNHSSISNSYSIGAVSGGTSTAGGFAGIVSGSSTLASDYWDTNTSGLTKGIGDDGNNQSGNVTGLKTTQLESALPAGFYSAAWGTGPRLLPYLLWQFPSGTPQAIAGQVVNNGTAVVGDGVLTYINGIATTPALSAQSTASGFYYLLFEPGTLNGQQVLTYVPGGGARLLENLSATDTGAQINIGYTSVSTADTLYSQINKNLLESVGRDNKPMRSLFNHLGADLALSAANFSFDDDVAINLVISTSGTVTDSAGEIQGSLDVEGDGTFILPRSEIDFLTGNAKAIDLATNSGIELRNITTTGSLAINALSITGTLTAAEFSGSATMGNVTLSGDVAQLGDIKTHGHMFSLTDDSGLETTGTVTAGGGTLDLATTSGNIAVDGTLTGGTVDLVSAGTISESTTGAIDATTLTGSSNGTVKLTSANNDFANLGTFTASGSFNYSFTDDADLTTIGAVTNGGAQLVLRTVGTDHDLAIDSAIGNGVVTLVTTGKATESSSGAITASTLNVTANTGIALTSSRNAIASVGKDKTRSGPNNITL